MIRRTAYIVFALLLCITSRAQDDFTRRFEEFTRSVTEKHASFTDSVNAVFAEALKFQWEEFSVTEGTERSEMPVPEQMDTASRQDSGMELPVSETVVRPSESLSTESIFFNHNDSNSQTKKARFTYCGTSISVTVPSAYGSFHPGGIAEKDVSSFWKELASYDYNLLTADILKCRQTCGLNDWAVLECVLVLSETLFPQNVYSERAIFTVFLLNQMGLMAKIARSSQELCCLFPSQQKVYARKFVKIDDCPYYLASGLLSASELFTYRTEFGRPCHPVDLKITVPPALGGSAYNAVIEKPSSVLRRTLRIPVNKAILSFYGRYPQTDPVVHATARPCGSFGEALFAQIRDALGDDGTARDKLGRILKFVQEDFRYKVDLEQFGYERPFFVEENFAFEYNDCEDRAVLMSFLVRGVLGLRTVLLDYPDHFALAVELPEEIKGDFVRHGGARFYVCDPSYTGAPVGVSMPKYRTIPAKVWAVE